MKCVISALFFAIWFGAGRGTKIHASPLISHLDTKKSSSVNGLTLSLTKVREASKMRGLCSPSK